MRPWPQGVWVLWLLQGALTHPAHRHHRFSAGPGFQVLPSLPAPWPLLTSRLPPSGMVPGRSRITPVRARGMRAFATSGNVVTILRVGTRAPRRPLFCCHTQQRDKAPPGRDREAPRSSPRQSGCPLTPPQPVSKRRGAGCWCRRWGHGSVRPVSVSTKSFAGAHLSSCRRKHSNRKPPGACASEDGEEVEMVDGRAAIAVEVLVAGQVRGNGRPPSSS